MRIPFLRQALCLAAAATPLATGVAAAQNVGEVTVFAQKREQRLQDIPVAVAAFNSQALEDAGVRDIKELTILTPGLLVTSTSNETVTTARIRGVGTVGDNPGLESSVGVVIDGVYRPRNGVGFNDLGEIERIEVLKGPQGTLFGKNTSAGVIQVFTKRPQYDWGSNGEITFGEYNTLGYSGSITGPIVDDKVAFRLFGAQRKRDGYMDVRTGAGPRSKKDDYDQDFYTFRGQLLFEPSSSVSINLIADFTSRDENCCTAVTLPSPNKTGTGSLAPNVTAPILNGLLAARSPGSVAINTALDPFARIAFSDRDTTQRIEDQGFSSEINADLGAFGNFTSVTAFRSWDLVAAQDADFSAADLLWRPADGSNGNEFQTVSQEVRLAGTTGIVEWLVGAFYANEDLTSKARLLYGQDFRGYASALGLSGALGVGGPLVAPTVFATGSGTRDIHEQRDRTWAAFTQNTINFTDRFAATLGARYTSTGKSLTSVYQTTGGSCDQALAASLPASALGLTCITFQSQSFDRLGANRQKLSESEFSGTVKLAFDVTDDILTYAAVSRGYKAGGFNLDREGTANPSVGDGNTKFNPEFVDSYEAGVKTTWLDGKLVLNASVFRNEFNDFQLNTFLGTVFVVVNVPEVTSEGFEVEGQWQTPIDGLNLNLAANVSETTYGPFTVSAASALLPGATMSFAPKYTISGGANYERMVGANHRFRASLNGRYVDDYSTASDLLPAKNQEAFLLLNGRIGFGTADEKYTLELWGTNLTDEDYIQVGFNGTLQGSATSTGALVVNGNPRYNPNRDTITYKAFLGAPRVLGATFKVKY